jgi:hypothetical protein
MKISINENINGGNNVNRMLALAASLSVMAKPNG